MKDNYVSDDLITGIQTDVAPEDLFEALLNGTSGDIHLNGLLIKKVYLLDEFLFNDWPIGQDTLFIHRLVRALKIKVFPRHVVANRRVHHNNRWTASMEKRMFYYRLFILELFSTFDLKGLKNSTLRKIFILRVKIQYLGYTKCTSNLCKIAYVIKSIFVLMYTEPQIIRHVFKAHLLSSVFSKK